MPEFTTISLKQCHKCKQYYPATREFFLFQQGYLTSPCRICKNKQKKEYNEKYPELKKRRASEWLANNRDKNRASCNGNYYRKYQSETAREKNCLKSLGMLQCTTCGEVKPATLDFFIANRHRSLGINPTCRKCARDKYEGERRNKGQKKQRLLSSDGYRTCSKCERTFPETTEYFVYGRTRKRFNCYCKQCANANNKKLRRLNPELSRYYTQKWEEAHPEKNKERSHRRRARKYSLPATFTADNWKLALKSFHGCCAYCGNPPSLFDLHTVLHQDHYIPVSRDGGYTPDNILPACQNCNLSKNDSDPVEWLTSRFGPRKAKRILARVQDRKSVV